MAETVRSVQKATEILGCFDSMNRLMTVREIAARTGIPRSTVHDICRTLSAANFLEARPDGGFQLGLGLAMLGGQVIERFGLVDKAQQPIQRYLDRYGMEIHIAAHVPGAVFYAFRKRAVNRVATLNRTGKRWDITRSACGRAILATMAPAAREVEYPPHLGDAERAQLEFELGRFPAQGFVVSDVSQPGLRSIGAPVFDSSGLAVGAIGVADTHASMNRKRILEVGPHVRLAALETSRAMGYSGAIEHQGV